MKFLKQCWGCGKKFYSLKPVKTDELCPTCAVIVDDDPRVPDALTPAKTRKKFRPFAFIFGFFIGSTLACAGWAAVAYYHIDKCQLTQEVERCVVRVLPLEKEK